MARRGIYGDPIYFIWLTDKLIFHGSSFPRPDGPVHLDRIRGEQFCDDMIEGFFHNKEEAVRMVKDNADDMYESCFKYAVIEEVYPGLNYLGAESYMAFRIELPARKYVEIDLPVLKQDEVIKFE